MLILSLLLACDGGSSTKDGDITLVDANNYAYTAALNVSSVDVMPGSQLQVDWGGVTTDLLGHTLDPSTEINLVEIIGLYNHTQAQTAEGLADGTISQQDIGWAFDYIPSAGETSADTTDFEISGAIFDPGLLTVNENTTYMIRVGTGKGATADTRQLIFVHPSDSSTNTAVSLSPTSTTLDFAADLDSLQHVAATTGSMNADWSALTTAGDGTPIDWTLVSQLWIASFDGMDSATLASGFLDLESNFSSLYTVQMYGQTEMDLSTAIDGSGAAFTGFTTGTTWVMALRCPDYCTNPAPPFFTLVDVTE